jgi:hypothetical protein
VSRDVSARPTTHELDDKVPLDASCAQCAFPVSAVSVLGVIEGLEAHGRYREREDKAGLHNPFLAEEQ